MSKIRKTIIRRSHFILIRFGCFIILSAAFAPVINAQKTRKNFSITTSENNTSIEKITVLYNELYSFGCGGSGLVFRQYEPDFMVSSPRKLFIAKYNDTGAYRNAVSLGGNANNMNGGMCTFPNNLICVSGAFSSGYYEGNNLISNNSKGIFITTLDSSLNFKWRLTFNANKSFHCNLLTPDGNGNFFAAGYFTDSIKIGTAWFKSSNHKDSTDFNKDIFILHITQNGTILNTFTMGSFGNDYPTALSCDGSGNAIVAAIISDTVMLGDQIYQQQSKSKSVLFKLSPTGKTSWITGFSGAGVSINSLGYNSKNEIVCGASFSGGLIIKYKNSSQKITTDGLSDQIFIGVFDDNGKMLRYKTEGSDNGLRLKAICLDKDDNIFVSGTFQCTFTSYNKQNETFSFKNIGYNDIFLSAYNTKLDPLWQKHAGGPREDNLTDLDIWQNRPTISGYFSQRFYVSSDSVYPLFNGNVNYSRYYQGNSSYNPWYLDISGVTKYSSGRTNNSGFITNVMDSKSPQLNYYRETGQVSPKFTEKPTWQKDLYNFSDTFCNSASLRFLWVKDQDRETDFEARYNGPFLDYFVNGNKSSYRNVNYEPISTTTGTFKVDLKTIDGCYSETIQKKLTVLKTEYSEIGYDKTKLVNNQYFVICNKDSAVLTANKTFGLKYFWIVDYQDYLLDTGTTYDTTDKYVYRNVKRDTFYTKNIIIKKSAGASLILENNDLCKQSTSLIIRKLGFETTDSLIASFVEESDSLCTSNTSASTAFYIKILDKKTGLLKNVTYFMDYKINSSAGISGTYYTGQNIGFNVNQSGTYKIEGTVNLGCSKKTFSIEKYYNIIKPKINFIGKLSKCKDEENIFIADSGFKRYSWYAYGTPVKPVITYITPWKIKVKGSVSHISVTGWLDTIPYNSCGASAQKNVTVNSTSNIISNTNPAIICPGKSITLSVNDGTDFLWFPNGEKTKQITTNIPGIYYCTYNDTAGCPVKSSSMELGESFKPDLLIEPDDGVCPGQNAEIFVIVPKYSTINWIQPASWGNSSRITTQTTGIVKCSTNVCNTPYIMQANIVVKQPNVQTVYHYDSACYGQPVKLESHDSETYIHNWSYLKNVVFKNSKITSYTSTSNISDKKTLYIDSAGIYMAEAKDLCDNWYKTDFYIIKSKSKPGASKVYQKDICGNDSFFFDLKTESKPPLDPFNKCRWLIDNDTSFIKKFYSVTAQYKALINNKYCSWADTVILKVKNKVRPQVSIFAKREVCKGEIVQLKAILKPQGWDSSIILWSNNLGTGPDKTAIINTLIQFKASINDTCGISSDSITIIPRTVKADFNSSYDPDLDKIMLTDNSSGINIAYRNWYLDNLYLSNLKNTEILNPLMTERLVCLKISNEIGCKDSICKILEINKKADFYIPTVFNPTSGISGNSRFAPIGGFKLHYHLLIFNRWGEKLFDGHEDSFGWDGTYKGAVCQDGAYMYIMQVTYTDAKGFHIEKNLKGTIMMLR